MDFTIANHGSIAILTPLSAPCREWVDENVIVAMTLGQNGIVIEHRYVGPIVEALVNEGFEGGGQ